MPRNPAPYSAGFTFIKGRQLRDPHIIFAILHNMKEGRVIEEHKISYVVSIENKDFTANVRGSFFDSENFPKVGDFVLCSPVSKGKVIIEKILPRKSSIIRKQPNREAVQVIATNIDFIFIVMGLDGDFNLNRLERYLLLAKQSNVTPVVILNKADKAENLNEYVNKVKVVANTHDVHVLSAKNKQNMEVLLPYFTNDATIVLLGSSGAGKSTITNWLLQTEKQTVKKVREDDSKGKHTTTKRQLFKLPTGGFLVDTPGMRELGMVEDASTEENEIFEKLESLAKECAFTNCDHKKSVGCAIQKAIKDGAISEREFKNAEKLKEERLVTQSKKYEEIDRKSKVQKKRNIKRLMKSENKNDSEKDF